jgi:hypothetical protein
MFMNDNRRLSGRVGFTFCIALASAGLLTGCITYVEAPPQPVAYAPPPPPQPPPVDYAPSPAESPVVVIQAQSDFYEPLNPYGRWVVVGSYGHCWCPNGVEAGWRPYCYGHWESTDAGWYWVSDEPWGWATYHYGRWVYDPDNGWAWVPQTQWAPAWVVWREGGGYCGWAPLGVSARVGVGGAFNVGVVAPSAFVFVEERHFLEPVRPTTVVVNETIVNTTVNITKIQVVNKTVVNIGPRVEVIQRATGRQIQTVPVNQLRRKQETDVVAKQPQVKTLHQARAQKPVQGQAVSEPEHHAVPPAETDEERQQKAQSAEKQREQNAEREQAEKEKKEQATEQGREQKTQDVEKQQEQKGERTQAQKDEQTEKQQQQEKRKAAEKAAAEKKKTQEEEEHRAKEQPAQ